MNLAKSLSRILAAVLAVVALAAVPAVAASASTAAPAAPAVISPAGMIGPGLGEFQICATKGGGKCLDEGSSNAVITDPNNGSNQRWGVFGTSCHTVNTSDCEPFTNGSGMNSEFAGDKIVDVQAQDGRCLYQASGLAMWHESNCDITGHEWVIDGWSFVNPTRSNTKGVPAYLTSTGIAGGEAVVQTDWVSGNSQWGSNNG